MNAQPVSIATIKKWEAIACDRINHALVVYKLYDGLIAVDVFEVLGVSENQQGALCLRALSLSMKYNDPSLSESTSTLSSVAEPENVVEILLSSIVESHRYTHGTGVNGADIQRYYESIAKVLKQRDKVSISRSTCGSDRLPDLTKSIDTGSGDLFSPWMGCMIWLLYAGALFAFALWMF